LGRTLGHARRILYAVLRVPCDFRTHWTVHITCRAESFTLQVSNNNNNTQWKGMSLHNRHPHDLSRPDVNKVMSNARLKSEDLFLEIDGITIEIQDTIKNTLLKTE